LTGIKARQRFAAHRRFLICREQHHAGLHRRPLLRHPLGRGRAVHDRGRLCQHRGRAAPALKPSGGEGRPAALRCHDLPRRSRHQLTL